MQPTTDLNGRVLILTTGPIKDNDTGNIYPPNSLLRVFEQNAKETVDAGFAVYPGIQRLVNLNLVNNLTMALNFYRGIYGQ